ncbi:hypothetical protein [Ferviditalea candida]|uniref:Thioesterase domain-containing protein n=1 Tax=Ferviditalea candida TaxID=3108399 RepID=A0ABU5ZHY7_9BACL|nr:hypothetical protein [Paenibacillaceae bacterium T2]
MSLLKPSTEKTALFLIAGVATSPDFMEVLREALVRHLHQSGGARISSKLLFPYGDWGRSVLHQLRDARHDMKLPIMERRRSIGGQFIMKEAEPLLDDGWRFVFIGHSAGGNAAVHAAQLLKQREPRVECRIVQIGSPKCPIPAELQASVSFLFAEGKRGRSKDPICRLGSWGGWERGRYGLPVWNRHLYAPSRIIPLQTIGGHADYFRNHPPFMDALGRSNLEAVIGAFCQRCLPESVSDD